MAWILLRACGTLYIFWCQGVRMPSHSEIIDTASRMIMAHSHRAAREAEALAGRFRRANEARLAALWEQVAVTIRIIEDEQRPSRVAAAE